MKAPDVTTSATTIDLDLCYMPATEQLRLFRARKLSPVEVLEAQLARAEQVEPVINAFTETFADEAMAAARQAEKVWTTRPDTARPLEGITVAVKDEMPVRGQRNTQGSLIYKDYIADHTHPVATRLQEAGAIFHARTTTPEFCCAWITASRLHGVTRNPWNPDYTCSGSSGGAGAALAAGTTTLATGSDIGGSIRGPAGANGIVGYKPPYGRVPDEPPFNLDWYCHVGPMARTVGDTAIMQNVISGIHPQDIATVREKMVIPTGGWGDLKGKRIAWTLDVGNGVVADEVAVQTMKVLDALSDAGASIEEVSLGWGADVRDGCKFYLDHLMGSALKREVEAHPDLVCDYTAFYAERSGTTTADQFLWSLDVAGDIYSRFGPMMEEYYAFICPTFATHEVRANQMPWERMIVQGRDFDSDYDCNLQTVFNMLSRLPVLAVPAGIAANGLPSGVQIAARAFDDPRVFHVASLLERTMPWLDRDERRPRFLVDPPSRGTALHDCGDSF